MKPIGAVGVYRSAISAKYRPQLRRDQYTEAVKRGYGEAEPVDSNDTEEGQSHNRRIEFRRL